MEMYEQLPVQRFTSEGKEDIEDIVIREIPLTIILNDQELVTLICSPDDLKYMAVGFLFSEGLLQSREEIKKVMVDERKGLVRIETLQQKEGDLVFKRLITTGCGRGASLYSLADAQTLAQIKSDLKVLPSDIFRLVKEFQSKSQVFKETGGVHGAALCDKNSVLIFKEDIGRHNAIDKIVGECMLNDISMEDRIMITSGRISSEIMFKVVKRNIPILVSRSAPTNVGVKLANELGLTLIGFVRGSRMNVYANAWRIIPEQIIV
ncbi:MAG: formate dehydrogenase accessory sulfurtransferase FdhD [Chloroflexi bacterium]|nr:formate dehydrogenase accessory sulfurtransferase FdhD [Chloroflexota bacterium]